MPDDITHQQILDAITGIEARLTKQFVTTAMFRRELAATKREIIDDVNEQLSVITDNMVTKADLRAAERRWVAIRPH